MRLALIYNVWDDHDWLMQSINHHVNLAEGIIVVYSNTSNFGEISNQFNTGGVFYQLEPDLMLSPSENERRKRNYGLQLAKSQGYTHFLMIDADEFYDPVSFLAQKERIFKNDIAGTVCRTKVYFSKPTLTIGFDTTLVPFIHKLTPSLRFEWNTRYPYAFEGAKKDIRIDPTRQLNINSGVEMINLVMHHYSWVRKDYAKKIRNSSARINIERSTVLTDLSNAKAGYYCEFYGKHLEATSNPFNLCV